MRQKSLQMIICLKVTFSLLLKLLTQHIFRPPSSSSPSTDLTLTSMITLSYFQLPNNLIWHMVIYD